MGVAESFNRLLFMGIRDGEEKVIISPVNHFKEKNERCGSHTEAVNHVWMLKCGCGLHWGVSAFVFIDGFVMAMRINDDKVEKRKEGMRR